MKPLNPALIALPLLALAGCADRISPVPVIVADAMHMASTGAAPGEAPLIRQTFDSDAASDSGIERCAQAAVAAVSGQLTQVSLKRGSATRIWEFGVRQADGSHYDLECDERRGEIIATLQRLPSADDTRFADIARVDAATARERALKVRAGSIEEVRHDLRDDGLPLYRYAIVSADRQRYRVTVNGLTGEVLDAAPSVLEIGSL